MKKFSFYLYALVYAFAPLSLAQQLTSSNLPIIVVNTMGQTILNEPKRTVTMTIYDNQDGTRNQLNWDTPKFSGLVGIEIRGQSSQSLFPKKSYGIEFRDSNDMDVDTSILGLPRQSDWVIHSPYSDKSLIRNALAYIIAGEIMDYAPRVRLAEMVINDEYHGLILWTESIKRDKNRVDISKLSPDENEGDDLTGGYILKFDKGESFETAWESPFSPIPGRSQKARFLYHYPKAREISTPQKNYIKTWVTQFENNLMSSGYSDPVTGYNKYINVKTFVDLIIVNELSKNVDGYRLSTYMYKDKDSKGGKLSMGPVWDYNLAFGNANYCEGSTSYGWGFNFNGICPDDFWLIHVWWNRLMIEDRFRQNVKDRWISLRNNQLSSTMLMTKVDSLVSLLGESQARNFIKWPVLGKYIWPNQYVGSNYGEEINYLKQWITNRTIWLDGAFKDLTTPVVNIEDDMTVNIFPNPSSGELFIDSEEPLLKAELYSLQGSLLRSVNLDKNDRMVALESINHKGVIIYKVFKVDGTIISGKISMN